MRTDIMLVPHCYDLKWSRDLNKALSEIFYNPFKIVEKSYLPGRSQQMKLEAEIIRVMRSKKINKVFFANYIDDFSNNFIKAAGAKKIYGLAISSNRQSEDVGRDDRLISYEDGIIPIADTLFTLSDYLGTFIDRKTYPIGLPLPEFKPPKLDSNKILFNHRLGKEKGLKDLYELQEQERMRFIISSPKGSLSDIPKLKKLYERVHFAPSDREYQKYINECGFEVSFNTHETFGMAVHEAIANGLCVLVPDNDTTNYKEMIIDELRFDSPTHWYTLLNRYTNDLDKRKEVILKQQERSRKYIKENWQKQILLNL